MNSRNTIFAAIRRSLGVNGQEAPRRRAVADRLSGHPIGVVPARGQLAGTERLDLFARMVEGSAGTVERIGAWSGLPAAVSSFLRRNELPPWIRRGADPMLADVAWEPGLTVATGPAEREDVTAVSRAFAGVAETGTVILISGADNPTALNFLSENHIVAVQASAVVGDYETALARLRAEFGPETLPRAVNMITGPSRSADIEQTLILGAHGPRRLHVILVGLGTDAAKQ
jgi:L-lactate dehydrogenase complex protein LldG